MSTHDESHQLRLERALTGETLTADDRRELERCAECAAELARLRAVERELREVRADERAILAESERVENPVGADLVRDFARERIDEARAAPGPRVRSSRLWIAIAAALLVTLGVSLWRRAQSTQDDAILNVSDAHIVLLPAQVDDGAYKAFSWKAELDPGGWFEVRVFAPALDGAGSRQLLHTSQRLYAVERWEPGVATQRDWPAQIDWHVVRHALSGPASVSEFGSASR
jgi:hypothetical protein